MSSLIIRNCPYCPLVYRAIALLFFYKLRVAQERFLLSQFTPPPKLSEEESASHSISSTSSSSSASCKPGDSTVVVAVSTERHEEALDRVRALEGTVERLQAENAALRVEPEWSSGLRSVQEEVSNVDVVRYVLQILFVYTLVLLSCRIRK